MICVHSFSCFDALGRSMVIMPMVYTSEYTTVPLASTAETEQSSQHSQQLCLFSQLGVCVCVLGGGDSIHYIWHTCLYVGVCVYVSGDQVSAWGLEQPRPLLVLTAHKVTHRLGSWEPQWWSWRSGGCLRIKLYEAVKIILMFPTIIHKMCPRCSGYKIPILP